MKKGEQNKKKTEDFLDYKTILTTMLCTVVAMLFILMFIFVGIRLASGDNGIFFTQNESDTVVAKVSHETIAYSYTLESHQYNRDNKTAYIFNELGVKYTGENFAVINSKNQLDQLLDAYAGLSGNEASYELEDDFFQTGSIVAIAIEDRAYADVQIPNVTRDNDYNLTVTFNAKRMSDLEISDDSQIESTLFLIKIQNIQPEMVEVDFNS